MAYIYNQEGVLVSIANNAPLPVGARYATVEEVAEYEAAEKIRAAAGIPAPKSPEQAALEHAALLENIKNRGGLATPTEVANLNTTAEQAGQASATPSASARGTKKVETPAISLAGRGASAGDQYVQYEALPGVAKVVTEEPATVASKTQTTRAAKEVEPRAETPPATQTRTQTREAATPPAKDVPNASDDFSTPEKRAANSPTAKDKEK